MTDPLPRPRLATLAGRSVAPLAFGTMRLAGAPPETVRACLEAAAEAGIGVVDTAPIYGVGGPGFGDVEERLGQAWRDASALRDAALVVTKAGILPGLPYDSSPEALVASCDASLRRLGVERIDLFLVHRPDHLAGHGAVAEALDGLIAAGKVAAVGVSNHTPGQVRALARWLGAPLAANQIQLSPVAIAPIEDGTLDLCEEAGILPMAWSPLGGGRLMGAEGGPVADALDRLAAEGGVGRDVAALAWAMAHPAGVMPVLGTARPERVGAAAVATSLPVTRPGWYAVLEAARGAPMP